MKTPKCPRYFSRKNILIALLSISVLTAVWIALLPNNVEESSAPAEITRVRRGDILITTSGEGSLQQISLPIGFVISGTLSEVAAPGETIEAGATLASLDASQTILDLQAADLDWETELAHYSSAALTVQQITAQENLDIVQKKYNEIVNGPDVQLYKLLLGRAEGDYWAAVRAWWSAVTSTSKKEQARVPRLRTTMNKAKVAWEDAELALDWAINYIPNPTAVLEVEAELAEAQSALDTSNLLAENLQNGELNLDLAASNNLPALQDIQSIWNDRAQAQIILNHTRLSAPFTGTVTQVNAQAGEWINAYQPLLTFVAEAPLTVEFSLDESDLKDLDIGDSLSLTLTAYSNLTFTGQVTQIAPVVNTSTAQLTVWGDIAPSDNVVTLLPGMSVDVEVTLAAAEDILLLSQQAIRTRDDGSAYVYRIHEDGSFEEVDVIVGMSDFANVEILSGLVEGDMISTAQN